MMTGYGGSVGGGDVGGDYAGDKVRIKKECEERRKGGGNGSCSMSGGGLGG